ARLKTDEGLSDRAREHGPTVSARCSREFTRPRRMCDELVVPLPALTGGPEGTPRLYTSVPVSRLRVAEDIEGEGVVLSVACIVGALRREARDGAVARDRRLHVHRRQLEIVRVGAPTRPCRDRLFARIAVHCHAPPNPQRIRC